MKNLKMVILTLALSSRAVMGQDYYSPTDKQKEPVARFPLDPLEIRTANGEKFIEYTLPEALTGETNRIKATAINVPGEVSDTVQLFVGPNATITCVGTDKNPGCMVAHRNLRLDRNKAVANINEKYFDPQLRSDAIVVMDDFQAVAHSGNQPIGVLGAVKNRDDSQIPRGSIQSYYLTTDDKQRIIATKATINWQKVWNSQKQRDELSPVGTYTLTNGAKGDLYNIKRFGNHVRGNWSMGGTSGWFDFEFSNDKARFVGTFGEYKDGVQEHKRGGVWNSSMP
jgi:hypothetical protein